MDQPVSLARAAASAMAVAMGLMVSALGAPAASASPIVTDVRVGEHDRITRVTLEINEKIEFTVFTLSDPERVVVDLPEVGWRLPARPLPTHIGLLARLRYGLFKPGQTRVVVDATGPVTVKDAFLLSEPQVSRYRLVLDLVPSAESGPPQTSVLAPPPAMPADPAAAERPSRAAAAVAPPKRTERAPRRRTVVLDPGHGGADPGASGISGDYEKHVTLTVAREFKEILEKTGRYRVILTRERDRFVRLQERIAAARAANAELFISLHADAMVDGAARGLSVYTLSEKASDKVAEELAERENKADLIAGVDLSDQPAEVTSILIDLAQRETMNQSSRFAALLVEELARETQVLRNTHRFAGFVVLKAPDVPSVLLELGFLSNRHEETLLRQRRYRGKLASAVVKALDAYFTKTEQASATR